MFSIQKYLLNVWNITNEVLVKQLLMGLEAIGYNFEESKMAILDENTIGFKFKDKSLIFERTANSSSSYNSGALKIELSNKNLVQCILIIPIRTPKLLEALAYNYNDKEIVGCGYIFDDQMKYLNQKTMQNVFQYVRTVMQKETDLNSLYNLEGGYGIEVLEDITLPDKAATINSLSLLDKIITFNGFMESGLKPSYMKTK